MLGAGQIQDNMLNAYQEMFSSALEFTGKWRFADIFYKAVPDPGPELFG